MQIGVTIKGTRIKDARLAAGMTQAELARAIQTTERNIVRWETGRNQPRVSSVAAIAKVTGHEIDFFLTESGESDDDEEAAGLTLDEWLQVRARKIARDETIELEREVARLRFEVEELRRR